LKTSVKDKVIELAAALGFYRAAAIRYNLLKDLLKVNGFDLAYGLLQDQASRELFVKLLAYRILEYRHVRLPLNDAKYWEVRRSLSKYVEKRGTVTQVPIWESLDLYSIKGIRLHIHPLDLLNTFLLEKYRCPRAGIGVNLGDVVIDAGACWGDTALHSAQNAAQVICFEYIRCCEG
jgi:hypothetical protein